jgi:glycosyltransferase involved in cell wall biosynthesis
MTKVLFVSYDGITDPLGQSQVLPYILELSRQGFGFTLLSCEKPDAYKKNKDTIEKNLEGTNVKWVPVSYTKKPPIISTLYDYWRLKRKAISLHRRNNFQIIHCRSYIPAMIGLWMKKKFRMKFVFDMRGFWADERVDAGLWNLKNIIYRQIFHFFKEKEKKFLENADLIVSLTLAAKKEISGWSHINKNSLPITVIPCCTDTTLFDRQKVKAESLQKARENLGIKPDEIVLTYLGSIGTWYLLDEMLAFFSVYLEKFPTAKFLFITQDKSGEIHSKAHTVGIPTDRILVVSSERASVPIYVLLGSYSIFFIRPSFSKISSSPTKQGELMALGIPVICNSGVGDTDMIVRKYDSGLIVESFNTLNYQEVVEKIKQSSFDKNKIRNGAMDYFALQIAVSKYKKIYDSLLS